MGGTLNMCGSCTQVLMEFLEKIANTFPCYILIPFFYAPLICILEFILYRK